MREYYEMAFLGAEPQMGHFSTIRLGDKWWERLQVGDGIGLVDGKGQPIGEARVTAVMKMPLSQALGHQLSDNHDAVAQISLDPNGRKLYVREVLKKCYGRDGIGDDELYTVVRMERFE